MTDISLDVPETGTSAAGSPRERAAPVGGLSRARFLEELARTKSDTVVVDFDDLRRELGLR